MTLETAKRRHVVAVCRMCGWNKSHAARALGVSRQTVIDYVREGAA